MLHAGSAIHTFTMNAKRATLSGFAAALVDSLEARPV